MGANAGESIFSGDLEKARNRFQRIVKVAIESGSATVLNHAAYMLALHLDYEQAFTTGYREWVESSLNEEGHARIASVGLGIVKGVRERRD